DRRSLDPRFAAHSHRQLAAGSRGSGADPQAGGDSLPVPERAEGGEVRRPLRARGHYRAHLALPPLWLSHTLDKTELFWNWWTWWQGDTSGMLLMTPLILSWAGPDTVVWTRRRILEGLLHWALLISASHLVFTGDFGRTFVLVPFIVWAAFRFGQRGVT